MYIGSSSYILMESPEDALEEVFFSAGKVRMICVKYFGQVISFDQAYSKTYT